MKMRAVWLSVLVVALCLPQLLIAQETASITGTVTDASGAAVANAEVTVSVPDKGINRVTKTNDSGEYLVAGLPSGPVNVAVAAPGFKKFETQAVVLRVGQKARNDVALQVGASSTEVTVEGTNIAQVETQSSELAGTVSGKQITQLQLNGRNFTQLVTLVPGVSNQSGQDEGTVGITGNVSYSINGGRTEYNNWELDGGDNMDNGSNNTLNVYPSVEAISEFKVLTSNYGAQYGRNGSGTVEVETKSGTNNFHGSAYEFVRNDVFNARNYFEDKVPAYKKNDFGYTVGGPIWKNKTFFFWSQEWRRERVPNDFFAPVPSLAERAGDFTDQCPGVSCPSVGANLIAAGYDPTDPNVQALLNLIPLPTTDAGVDSIYQATLTQPTTWREELLRIDHNLNEKNRITFRYIHDSWQTTETTPLWTNAGSFPTIGTDFKGPGISVVARMSSSFSPTLLNEFVFSYTTDHIDLTNTGAWQRPSNTTFGDLFGGNGGGIIPGINLVSNVYGGGFGQDPGYIPNGPYNSNPTYTYRDNLSKIVGRHNLQFGAYAAFGQKNELGGELGAGSIPGFLTFDENNTSISTGNAFADLLLGRISSFGQQDQRIKYYNRYKVVEPYFQDDWHITSRLTLNLGLRVSLFGTYREKKNQAFNFVPSLYVPGQTTIDPNTGQVFGLGTDPTQPVSINNLPNGMVRCGVTPGVPVSCMEGHLFNPAPRIGFAWDPKGNGRTSIRGGYGIFFEHANGNEGNTESLENSPPLATTVQQNNILGYSNIGSSSGSIAGQFPLSINAIPTKAVWPYIQQWHLDVQHELLPSMVGTISYVGSKGTHLNRQTNYNQIPSLPLSLNPYAPGEPMDTSNTDCTTLAVNGLPVTGQAAVNLAVACGANPDPFRPFQGYGDIAHLEFASSSVYHALQMALRRSVGGLELSGAYTYSHSIDDSSSRFDSSFVDSANPRANRASSNFDQRHIFSFSYVWDLPFFKSPGLVNKVLGNWQYSGITTFSTGTPYSVLYPADNAGVANGLGSGSRADIVGDPTTGFSDSPQFPYGPLFANPGAFSDPRGLTYGNSGRNILRNPHRTNFDMALFKRFPIHESIGLELRAEAFNVFNHTQWEPVAGDAGSAASNIGAANNTFSSDPTFLRSTSAHLPRILQFGAKFIF